MEVQRHATIAPTSPPRVAVKETTILGHTIPKVNIKEIHNNFTRFNLNICVAGQCFVN